MLEFLQKQGYDDWIFNEGTELVQPVWSFLKDSFVDTIKAAGTGGTESRSGPPEAGGDRNIPVRKRLRMPR